MKHRRVFSAADLATAKTAIEAARASGIQDGCISLITRADVELESIPAERLDATTDTIPAAIRGAAEGGAIGLVAGLVAILVPAIGMTIGGAVLLTAIGAMVGTWSSALIGSAIPNEVRRQFEHEIERGRILVVIDGDRQSLAAAETALIEAGTRPLPFDHLSLTS